ncbi:MAG TPA: chemotaxis protein CheX [Gemmataceae bacterium]|nr:chemotaxis protein CheX [Gemmataceae bacterium]
MATSDGQLPREDARAIPEDLLDQFLEPFIAAACVALREWTNTDVVVRDVHFQIPDEALGEVAAGLSLISTMEGELILSCSEQTAASLAGRILDGVQQNPEEWLIRDCLGEVANVIAGQAKALLADTPYSFAFSTPTVVSGGGEEIRPQTDVDCVIVAFRSDVGDLALQLFLNR